MLIAVLSCPLRRTTPGILSTLGGIVACLAIAGSSQAVAPASWRSAFVWASSELADRLDSDGADIPARVTLGPGGRDIRLAGDLTEGVSARVAALIAAHPDVRRIHLTSGGGLVDEGLALGAVIADHGLATYVPDYCASSCTLVFVRGRERYLATGGRLGFHAPYEAGLFGQTFAVDAAPERAAYMAAGIAPDFTAKALAVSSDDIWIPDAARLIRAGVVTEVVATDRFPDSTLDDDASPQAARTQVISNLPILAAADPDAVDRIAAWYRDGYAEGRSESDAIEGLRAKAAAHLRFLFRKADDGTIRALGHAAFLAMREADAGDPDACEAIAGGDLVVVEETLRSARHPVPSMAALVAQARRRGGTATTAEIDGSATARPRRRARRLAGQCGLRTEAMRRALKRPVREMASALRPLLLDDAQPDLAGVADP